MRKAALLVLLLLAACDSGAPPKDKVENILITDGPSAAESADASFAAAATVAATIAPVPPPAPAPVKHFQALGTEPFWSVDVLQGKLRYSSPENLEGTTFASTEAKDGSATRYIGTLEGKLVTLRIEPGTCSDGMSDTVYAYKASFTWGAQTERGCARTN